MASKRKAGRPKGRNPVPEDKAESILNDLAHGKSLREAAKKVGLTHAAILFWVRKDPDFADRYAQAKEVGLEVLADDIIRIADDLNEDPMRSRLRVDARKWVLCKLVPKVYGDRQHVEHEGGINLRVVTGVPRAEDD